MPRIVCWLLLGHRRIVCGSRQVRVVSDMSGEYDATDVLYRCARCSTVFVRRVKGDWAPEQVTARG